MKSEYNKYSLPLKTKAKTQDLKAEKKKWKNLKKSIDIF